MPNFLEAVRALSNEAIPAPWEVYESDDGEWGLVHRRANGMVRPVADFPGSGEGGSSASDASVDLVELLRNSVARIAAVVEAGKALVEVLDQTPVYGTHNIDAWRIDRRETAYLALRAALTALDTEPT